MADGQKAAYGCDIAPPVKEGHKLKDSRQRSWTVGKAVGAGGFGAIYLCDHGEKSLVSPMISSPTPAARKSVSGQLKF